MQGRETTTPTKGWDCSDVVITANARDVPPLRVGKAKRRVRPCRRGRGRPEVAAWGPGCAAREDGSRGDAEAADGRRPRPAGRELAFIPAAAAAVDGREIAAGSRAADTAGVRWGRRRGPSQAMEAKE